MDIIDKIDMYINEGKDELTVQWDEAQRLLDKMKKGKAWGKKNPRINKTLAELAVELEKVIAKRDLKKVDNWFKRPQRRGNELKNKDDEIAYRDIYVKLSGLLMARTQKSWKAEGYD
jgi:hypothetical protein